MLHIALALKMIDFSSFFFVWEIFHKFSIENRNFIILVKTYLKDFSIIESITKCLFTFNDWKYMFKVMINLCVCFHINVFNFPWTFWHHQYSILILKLILILFYVSNDKISCCWIFCQVFPFNEQNTEKKSLKLKFRSKKNPRRRATKKKTNRSKDEIAEWKVLQKDWSIYQMKSVIENHSCRKRSVCQCFNK